MFCFYVVVMVKQVKVQSHQHVLFLSHGDGEAGQSSKSSVCSVFRS